MTEAYTELLQENSELEAKILRLEQENKAYKQLLRGCPADSDDCGFCEIDKFNKKLEQENKELLEKLNEAQDDIESLTNANNYYFKENSRLKNELDVAYIKDPIARKEVVTLYGKPIELWIKVLRDIKDICLLEPFDSECNWIKGITKIRNKISEVL